MLSTSHVSYRTDALVDLLQAPFSFHRLGVQMDADTQLSQSIAAELKSSPILRYAQLSLRVDDGTVTISGRVNTLAERKAVERAAKRVAGVRTLILEIRAKVVPLVAMTQ